MDLPSDWTLTNVKESERDLLEQLLQFYLYDFSEMDDEEVDESGRFRYPVTGPYGREPGRHALLLRVRGKPAGFVLVDERSPIPGSEDRRYVREFFVMRAYRRHGYGAAMAWAIFDRFPGRWQVEQIGPNVGAQAFWRRVNQQGGIGGYDIDATTYVRDNKYDVATHKRAYQEIRTKVLALAQTLGSPMTTEILPLLKKDKMVASTVSWTSLWEFEDILIKSGTNYCFEAMNAVDYAVEAWGIDSVMAVHYPGDYGFIPQTYYDDGDPLDVLVMTNLPTFTGCIVEARPIGMFRMLDRGEPDDKILAVLHYDPFFADYASFTELPAHYIKEVEHFFAVYKDLEGARVEPIGWEQADIAKERIRYAINHYWDMRAGRLPKRA